MKLYIDEKFIGTCKSYEQIRRKSVSGWLFRMEEMEDIFIDFENISRFTSGDGLRIFKGRQ